MVLYWIGEVRAVQRPIWVEGCACAGKVRVPPHTTTPLDRDTTSENTLHPRYIASGCFFPFFVSLSLSFALSICGFKPKDTYAHVHKKHTEIVGVQGVRIGCEEVLLVVSWAQLAVCHVSSSVSSSASSCATSASSSSFGRRDVVIHQHLYHHRKEERETESERERERERGGKREKVVCVCVCVCVCCDVDKLALS